LYLAKSHPKVALRLLSQYFALGDHFDTAQAHVQRAEIFTALGDIHAALTAYGDALERERHCPGVRTQAYVQFACLVANERVASLYAKALEVLDAYREPVLLPIERYGAFGARALILQALGRSNEARSAAEHAMAAARETKSGFRYHPRFGLVQSTQDEFGRRVTALASAVT
jgi:hypothetical protein